MAYVSAPNVAPLGVEFLVEGLQCADILLDLGQPSLLDRLGLRHVVRIVTRQLQLQLPNLRRQEFGVRSEATDAGPDLVDTALETTVSGDTNELANCASTPELAVDGGLLAEHVAVANAEDPGARFAAPCLVLVEEPDAPLNIIGLPLLGGDRHAEHSSQEVTKVVGGVGVEVARRPRMSGEESCAFPAVVVFGWVTIQMTMGPRIPSPSSPWVRNRAAFTAE